MTAVADAPPGAAPATTDRDPYEFLTIDQVATESKRSRSTVERALRAFRDDPKTGLEHRKPVGRLKGTVTIRRRWMDEWMAGRVPEGTRKPHHRPPARNRSKAA